MIAACYCLLIFLVIHYLLLSLLFFFNDTATTEIYTLSLHDALPIYDRNLHRIVEEQGVRLGEMEFHGRCVDLLDADVGHALRAAPTSGRVPERVLLRVGPDRVEDPKLVR